MAVNLCREYRLATDFQVVSVIEQPASVRELVQRHLRVGPMAIKANAAARFAPKKEVLLRGWVQPQQKLPVRDAIHPRLGHSAMPFGQERIEV